MKSGLKTLEFLFEISHHKKSVNMVRFSPTNYLLATAGDDGTIFLFSTKNKQTWAQTKNEKELEIFQVRGHASDVYALAWSHDGKYMASGSIDSNVIVWEIKSNEAKFLYSFRKHCHFVQGIAFNPISGTFISQGSDKACKVYANKQLRLKDIFETQPDSKLPTLKIKVKASNYAFLHDISKRNRNPSNQKALNQNIPKRTVMFEDDTLPSFVRRGAFSPDGSLFIAPAGVYKNRKTRTRIPCCYLFSSIDMKQPYCCLTGFKPAVCISFCPISFCLQSPHKKRALYNASYRYIFAVLTLKETLIYCTESGKPIAIIEEAHFAQLTDACWLIEENSVCLFVSSSDGYISIYDFSIDELGTKYKEAPVNTNNALNILNVVSKEKLMDYIKVKKRRITAEKIVPVNASSNLLESLRVSCKKVDPKEKSGKDLTTFDSLAKEKVEGKTAKILEPRRVKLKKLEGC